MYNKYVSIYDERNGNMKFNVELKRVVDDSYDIEIGGALQDKCVGDI